MFIHFDRLFALHFSLIAEIMHPILLLPVLIATGAAFIQCPDFIDEGWPGEGELRMQSCDKKLQSWQQVYCRSHFMTNGTEGASGCDYEGHCRGNKVRLPLLRAVSLSIFSCNMYRKYCRMMQRLIFPDTDF